MVIFLPLTNHSGGPLTFASNFKKAMENRGHRVYFSRPKNYDLLLVVIKCPFRYLLEAKIKKIPIVQRLDSVYYPGVSGPLWRYYNLPIKIIRNYLADKIIYQSEFSRQMCQQILGSSPASNAIIFNGADLKKFSPQGDKINLRDHSRQKIILSICNCRRTQDVQPIFETLKRLVEKNLDFKLILISRLTRPLKKFLANKPPQLQLLPPLPHEQLARYLRGSDLLLYTERSACPNVVIEALACGLPIVHNNRGALPELVPLGLAGELIDNLNKVLNNLEFYRRHARQTAEQNFNIDKVADKYLKFIIF